MLNKNDNSKKEKADKKNQRLEIHKLKLQRTISYWLVLPTRFLRAIFVLVV